MIPPITAFKVIASAAAAILTTATINNTIETISIISSQPHHHSISHNPNTGTESEAILSQYLTVIQSEDDSKKHQNQCTKFVTTVPMYKSKKDVLHDLQCMKRKDLLTLFKYCDNNQIINDSIELSTNDCMSLIQGEWNGLLLHNNLVLVRVVKMQ